MRTHTIVLEYFATYFSYFVSKNCSNYQLDTTAYCHAREWVHSFAAMPKFDTIFVHQLKLFVIVRVQKVIRPHALHNNRSLNRLQDFQQFLLDQRKVLDWQQKRGKEQQTLVMENYFCFWSWRLPIKERIEFSNNRSSVIEHYADTTGICERYGWFKIFNSLHTSTWKRVQMVKQMCWPKNLEKCAQHRFL